HDFVIVSGGAQGVTAATLRALAAQRPLRFLLLGRTEASEEPSVLVGIEDETELKRQLIALAAVDEQPLDLARIGEAADALRRSRAVRATIHELEQAGSEVRYVRADVRDGLAVSRAVASAAQAWGRPVAVVHGAGAIADKLVVDKTDSQARAVLETK